MSKEFYTHKFKDRAGRRATVCGILEGNHIKFGIAVCSGLDQFSKKLGRKIAKGRAEKIIIDYTLPDNLEIGKRFINIAENLVNSILIKSDLKK